MRKSRGLACALLTLTLATAMLAQAGLAPYPTDYAAFQRTAEIKGLHLTLAGRAEWKAAFLVFVGSGEVKEPSESERDRHEHFRTDGAPDSQPPQAEALAAPHVDDPKEAS